MTDGEPYSDGYARGINEELEDADFTTVFDHSFVGGKRGVKRTVVERGLDFEDDGGETWNETNRS